MRDPLYKNEFEDFLYKQVSNHRMYPADQIWRNIQKEIHGEGRWPALTFISIFIITALSVCTMMVKPEDRLHKNSIVYPTQQKDKIVENTAQGNTDAAASLQNTYTQNITQKTMQTVSDFIVARDEKEIALWSPAAKESLPLISNEKAVQSNETNAQLAEQTIAKTSLRTESLQSNAGIAIKENNAAENIVNYAASRPASRYFSTLGLIKPDELKKPLDNTSLYDNNEAWRKYPLLTAKDMIRKTLSKLSFQFYITPSVSYRSLNDANGKAAQPYTALPANNNYQLAVNHVVEHHPEMGVETGFALGYKLSKKLTIKGGLQFNVRQYSIKAYTLPLARPSSAITAGSIANNNLPDQEAVADNSYLTSAANTDVSRPVTLNNRYFEIAAPIGIDWRIAAFGNGRVTVNVAAALQPTYTFDKEPFTLSANYKTYTDGASIMRNWNLNSNVETYISYKMGAFRWQIGPQFRFQHFSTYSNSYPIREHLLDYGVKIGFTKSLD